MFLKSGVLETLKKSMDHCLVLYCSQSTPFHEIRAREHPPVHDETKQVCGRSRQIYLLCASLLSRYPEYFKDVVNFNLDYRI